MLLQKGSITIKFVCLSIILLFLSLSAFSFKVTYIPVVTIDSETALMEGCPEHIDEISSGVSIRFLLDKAQDEDHYERLCFCFDINTENNQNFYIVKQASGISDEHSALFVPLDAIQKPVLKTAQISNKSPPLITVYKSA